jgi:hypothetical protein
MEEQNRLALVAECNKMSATELQEVLSLVREIKDRRASASLLSQSAASTPQTQPA